MSTNQPSQTAAVQVSDGSTPDARQLRAILITVSIALMAVIASVSGLNVAQPHMAVEFGASQNTILWFINIYTLTLAALLLPLGAIGDRLGRKPMLIAGLIIFVVASAAAGLAPSTAIMIAARAAVGISAAMIMPITLAVITPPSPRNITGAPDSRGQCGAGTWRSSVRGGWGRCSWLRCTGLCARPSRTESTSQGLRKHKTFGYLTPAETRQRHQHALAA